MHKHTTLSVLQIVSASVAEKSKEVQLPTDLTEDTTLEVTFSYSVSWKENKK